MEGNRKKNFQATNCGRIRKRRAEGYDDKTAEEKKAYPTHRRDLSLKKKQDMTADKLKAFNTKRAAKSKVRRSKLKKEGKDETADKKKACLTHRRASYTKQKGIAAADNDSTEADKSRD
ncbi:MAG: hypothetical protein LQ347_001059 [Umbilicaria vellea]|nr:MAG: hypothetical protein LQ347_001059 [Umbilicaria vellea]